MTLYQFIQADEMEQAESVWDGTFTADRQENEHCILLYRIDGFFEVFYHIKYNVVRKYRPFSSIDLLHPYLSQINLDDVLN